MLVQSIFEEIMAVAKKEANNYITGVNKPKTEVKDEKNKHEKVKINKISEPGARPFSLLCPKCGATDNFFFQALEVGGNSGGDLLVICGYCESKLIPDKHFAGSAREIYEKLIPGREDPPGGQGQDPAHPGGDQGGVKLSHPSKQVKVQTNGTEEFPF